MDEHRVKIRGKTFKNALEGKIPRELLKSIPSSIDVIGDIAIIKLPEEAFPYSELIGEAVTKVMKNIRAVYASAPVTGEFRIRPLRHIYGLKKSKTIAREYGISIVVDVLNTYYNPSLSEEHHRLALIARDNEIIGDFFCGVGPFTLHIATLKKNSVIYSVDKNPDAISCLLESLKINKKRIKGDVVAVTSDLMLFINAIKDSFFDRIIANLPLKAHEFVSHIVNKLKVHGYVHIYTVSTTPEEASFKIVSSLPAKMQVEVKGVRRVLDYAPHKYVYRVDLERLS